MTALVEPAALVAMAIALQPTMRQELFLGGAAMVTLVGVWLCWGAPRYRMSIEERVKDGKMTDDEARRRISRSQWFGPLVASIGVALLTFAITS